MQVTSKCVRTCTNQQIIIIIGWLHSAGCICCIGYLKFLFSPTVIQMQMQFCLLGFQEDEFIVHQSIFFDILFLDTFLSISPRMDRQTDIHVFTNLIPLHRDRHYDTLKSFNLWLQFQLMIVDSRTKTFREMLLTLNI